MLILGKSDWYLLDFWSLTCCCCCHLLIPYSYNGGRDYGTPPPPDADVWRGRCIDRRSDGAIVSLIRGLWLYRKVACLILIQILIEAAPILTTLFYPFLQVEHLGLAIFVLLLHLLFCLLCGIHLWYLPHLPKILPQTLQNPLQLLTLNPADLSTPLWWFYQATSIIYPILPSFIPI